MREDGKINEVRICQIVRKQRQNVWGEAHVPLSVLHFPLYETYP